MDLHIDRLFPSQVCRMLDTRLSVDQPLCSVCIANYNGIDVIGQCLESVLTQDFAHPIEIIVHDDASRDDSVAFIRSQYPNVKLLTSDTTVGYCVSNNRMVARARGRFLLLLNNDATLFPDALDTLYGYARQQAKPGILGLPQYGMQTGRLIDIGSHLDVFLNPIPNRDPNRLQVGMVTGACFWLPKSLWDELGGFPAFFGSLAEDLYLCCVARLHGYAVEALSRSGFHHWVGKSLGGGKVIGNALATSYRRRAQSERNRIFVMILTYPLPAALLLIPLYFMLLTIEGAGMSLLTGNTRIWIDVYAAAMKQVCTHLDVLRGRRASLDQPRRSRTPAIRGTRLTYHKLALVLRHGTPSFE